MERILLRKVRGGRQDQWRRVWSTRGRGVLVVESVGTEEEEEEGEEEQQQRRRHHWPFRTLTTGAPTEKEGEKNKKRRAFP